MPDVLTLGDVTFSDFEIPETLFVGGKQQLVVHSLPGGGRVVDVMGAAESPIRWSGIFSGEQAGDRVRFIETLRRGGQPQLLTWGTLRYTVIIQAFEAKIASSSWIPYQIELCVVTFGASSDADWLDQAQTPSLSIGLLTPSALDIAISAAAAGIESNDVSVAIAAAGQLAEGVTARAYGLVAS